MPRAAAGARVIVGLSGGVDSAVAALLLKEQGWAVQGLFMSNWEEDDDGYCTAAQDFQDARAIARELDIPLHRVSFARRVQGAGLRVFPQRAARRPDAESGRAVQSGDQVRRCASVRSQAGRLSFRHRSLRAPDSGPGRRRAAQGPGWQQGPELLPARRARPSICRQTLMPLGELEKSAVRDRARRAGLRSSTSRTAPASALSASARSGNSSAGFSSSARARSSRPKAK